MLSTIALMSSNHKYLIEHAVVDVVSVLVHVHLRRDGAVLVHRRAPLLHDLHLAGC